MNPADLDELLDRELKRLPPPSAPGTLLPRVMAAVAEQAPAPWYRRAWLTWPPAWQAVSIAALAVLIAGIALVIPSAQQATGNLAALLDGHAATRAIGILRAMRQVATLMRVSWEVLLQPVAIYVAGLMVAASLVYAAFWTALNRLALGGASHQ